MLGEHCSRQMLLTAAFETASSACVDTKIKAPRILLLRRRVRRQWPSTMHIHRAEDAMPWPHLNMCRKNML